MKDRHGLPYADSRQLLLFRVPTRNRCAEIGLPWWAALRLAADGYLSFDPEAVESLNAGQDAELTFLGSIVAGNYDRELLDQMLAGLEKPYAYLRDGMQYDQQQGRWLPVLSADEAVLEAYERLRDDADTDVDRLRQLQWSIASDLIDALAQDGDAARIKELAEGIAEAATRAAAVSTSTRKPT